MIEVIPAIDIIEGKCVRLSKGEYSQKKVYSENPLEVARMMEDAGCRRLHLVDLDGARSKHIVNHKVLERLASSTSLVIDFGGGLKSDEDLRIAFSAGAAMVTGGSIAVKEPEVFCSWIQRYGSDKIILGADARQGKIATSGWRDSSSEEIIPFIESYYSKGIRKVISTDINVDGMLVGPSLEMYKKILEAVQGIFLIASGGVASLDDVMALDAAGLPAVIVGKALYEGRLTLKELEQLNVKNS